MLKPKAMPRTVFKSPSEKVTTKTKSVKKGPTGGPATKTVVKIKGPGYKTKEVSYKEGDTTYYTKAKYKTPDQVMKVKGAFGLGQKVKIKTRTRR